MSLEDMGDSMEAGFLADLPKDGGGALAALERLDTPPPTPIFLSELESSPLSSAGLASPLRDSELEASGGDQDTMTMDALLSSCGVSCETSAGSPLLSSLDLMWGASPAAAAGDSSASAPAPVSEAEAVAAPEAGKAAGKVSEEAPGKEEEQLRLQTEVERLRRQQQRQEETKRLLERQLRELQQQQQQRDRQQQQRERQQQLLLVRQQKQAQRQKQQLHWQQLQQRQAKQQQQKSAPVQHCQQREDSGARSSGPPSAPAAAPGRRGPTKVRRKTRVITIPSSSSGGSVTMPHIVICSPSVINSRPAAASLPVTFTLQDRQLTAARVTARPTVTFTPRESARPLGLGPTAARPLGLGALGIGVRRRVVGRAAPGSTPTLAKRHSVESAPSSPETAPCSLLRIHSRQKPVLKVTTATQTGEAVDEVLRNNDSTLIRLLVTGQDLSNGYRLCPDGQCLTPERQPAPPSLFAGLPDRSSPVLLSMLSHDEEPQLPALFPSETAGRLLDDPL